VWRLFAALLPCVVLLASLSDSVAQSTPGGASDATSRLTSQNPVLAELARSTPAKLSDIVTRLERLTTGTRQDGLRGDTVPTKAETAQIAANPEFTSAYDSNPLATLVLLRLINETLRKAHLNGD
jgi:hypothetical protein